jgi:F-type H+-transporting ATPase subunit b
MAAPYGEIVMSPGIHELVALLNIVVIAAVVFFFFRKSIAQGFSERSKKLREDLVLTREELKRISQEIENARFTLSQIQKEKQELIAKVEDEGRALAKRLVDEATLSAQRIKEDTGRAMNAEFSEIQTKFKEELLEMLMQKALADFASENSQTKLHEKLIESFHSQTAHLSKNVQGAN